MAQVIKIVKKKVGNKDVVEPQDGKRTQVKKDAVVRFTFPQEVDRDPMPTITFTQGNPLNGAADYDKDLKVVGDIGKIFPYTCTISIGGKKFSTDDGGEMEIITP